MHQPSQETQNSREAMEEFDYVGPLTQFARCRSNTDEHTVDRS